MNPIVHAEISWLAAQGLSERRDRLLVTLAGVAPDVDGLSLAAGVESYQTYHHLITHGYIAAVLTSAACTAFARRRIAVAVLSLVTFHLHLLCDLLGSGRDWPIFYWWPTSRTEWQPWSHGWELASWQNTAIGLVVMLTCLGCAVPLRRTFVELFSMRGDALVVGAVRARLGVDSPTRADGE